jgi:pyrroloquinoline quinone biosynthesis protein B
MKIVWIFFFLGFCVLAAEAAGDEGAAPYVVVLGIAQDAGYPQAGCNKECCRDAWEQPGLRRFATSLALVDPATNQRWLFECTPDFREQLRLLDTTTGRLTLRDSDRNSGGTIPPALSGIFLTHAHIGHYAGLIHLGREVMGSDAVAVFAMRRMSEFLKSNGPWSQLVSLENIALRPLVDGGTIQLNERLGVTPFIVPHRDEFSETVGFVIEGPSKKILFIPDIDKWERWPRSIEGFIRQVDVAYLDATFYEPRELPGRDMSQIPHPFVVESIQRFQSLQEDERKRVRFIHMNHTNPAIRGGSKARQSIEKAGCRVAAQGEKIEI